MVFKSGPALLRSPFFILAAILLPAALVAACSSNKTSGNFSGAGQGGSAGTNGTGNSGVGAGMGGGLILFDGGLPDVAECALSCSADHTMVLDCDGGVVVACPSGQGCDLTTGACSDACQAAIDNKQSVGCDYYAPHLEMDYSDQCFAAFVANTWNTPAHISVEFYPGTPLNVGNFTYIPSGTGNNITYTPYNPAVGLATGQVAIVFLSGSPTSPNVPCPSVITGTAAAQGSAIQGTGETQAFHITTDVPVVAYQINPYGGGAAAITGASLLLPTSVWDTNYVAVTAAPYSSVTMDNPSINIVAGAQTTHVTLLPNQAIVGSAGGMPLPAGPANMPYTFTLTAGQQAQFSQQADLTGTVIQSDNPIGVMAGNACMQKPLGTSFCDHGEQMLPPVKALGNEYVAVQFRPRVASGDQAIWHLVGTVAGTQLTYSSSVGGPASLAAGQVVDFITDVPFVVTSQDTAHPFMLFAQMSGAEWTQLSDTTGYGDPDFVLSVPPQQYLDDYVFFTDVTYPETNLVVVRSPNKAGVFEDVNLDCAGVLTGWQPVGNYQWTRIDLMRHDFVPQGNCSNGAHEMKSTGLFGLWVWGWGSPETTPITSYVSYGYPGGMNVAPINGVVIVPTQM
jgi:IgGFc binding protein